jgi:hypothetical protein
MRGTGGRIRGSRLAFMRPLATRERSSTSAPAEALPFDEDSVDEFDGSLRLAISDP